MPEGDTVWNTAQLLERALAGRKLTRSDFRVPQLATADLSGWTISESTCRGKHLLLRLQNEQTSRTLTLHSHLRMDGSWRVFPQAARWSAKPAHLIRVALHTQDQTAVGYHLHEVRLIQTTQENTLVGHLGPDLLGPDWNPEEATRRIREHPETSIAEALLNQRNLAGIGNLYKCEALFISRTWPWTPVKEVTNLEDLVNLAHTLLSANRGRWLQTTTGSLNRSEANYVYGRRNRPCRKCRTPISKKEQADRITYWCPHCQQAP